MRFSKKKKYRFIGGFPVPMHSYWIEMMLADIVRSAGEIDNRTLLEELDGLCSALDCALANGHRVLW
jgi:hypothetical protein